MPISPPPSSSSSPNGFSSREIMTKNRSDTGLESVINDDDDDDDDNGNNNNSEHFAYTPQEEEEVVRKLDRHLLPLIFTLYSLSVLDRSNLGNARLAGLPESIPLPGSNYAWLGMSFYISYIVFQFLVGGWKLFPAHVWVTSAVFLWGFIATIQAACTTFEGLVVCRILLAIGEAMFGPGVALYFSFFYPRSRIGFRLGVFVSGSALANAYGGALAYALAHIRSGLANWRLLFILEGVPTALLAVGCWFWIPDGPGSAKFLTPRQRRIAQAFASRDDPGKDPLALREIWAAMADWKNWATAAMWFGLNTSFASLPLFLPTIISEMGPFSRLQANGLSAPPYLLSFIMIIVCSLASDRLQLRGPFVAGAGAVSAAGWAILATAGATPARYAATFLTTQSFVAVAVILPWVSGNVKTDSRRAGGFWVMQTIGQCGTLLGTRVFPIEDGPIYARGGWVCFGTSLLVVLAAVLKMGGLAWANRGLEKHERWEREGTGEWHEHEHEHEHGHGHDEFEEAVVGGHGGKRERGWRYVL